MKKMVKFKMKKISIIVIILFLSSLYTSSYPSVTKIDQPEKTGVNKKEVKDKVIEKERVKKKKKKFPVLLVITIAALTTSLVFLLKWKKNQAAIPANTEPPDIEWVDIPAGEFQMGDNFNLGRPDERPVHTVYLDAYKISKYEVTWAQYLYFCEKTGRIKPDKLESDTTWGKSNYPVTNVNWYDAVAFCEWLSMRTGNNIHLPTEAQWEKAARGTDQRKYPWGNSEPTCEHTNFSQCTYSKSPVGSYPAGVSPYGIHDMAGNVLEWCLDRYSSDYYSNSPLNNPQGPDSGHSHVYRGGCYGNVAFNIRTTFRLHVAPETSSHNIGIRLAMD